MKQSNESGQDNTASLQKHLKLCREEFYFVELLHLHS